MRGSCTIRITSQKSSVSTRTNLLCTAMENVSWWNGWPNRIRTKITTRSFPVLRNGRSSYSTMAMNPVIYLPGIFLVKVIYQNIIPHFLLPIMTGDCSVLLNVDHTYCISAISILGTLPINSCQFLARIVEKGKGYTLAHWLTLQLPSPSSLVLAPRPRTRQAVQVRK